MVLYIYKCPGCTYTKEVEHSAKEEPDIQCLECLVQMHRVIGTPLFTVRGASYANLYGLKSPKSSKD